MGDSTTAPNDTRGPRVAHLVPALFGGIDGIVGGAERYAFELARHMAHRVPTTLVSFGARDRTEHAGPLSVRVIGRPHFVRGQRTNPISLGLFRALRSVEVVHCHQQHILASSLAAIYCRLTGRRVFVSDLGGGGWDISGYVSTDAWYHGHLHISEYSRSVFGHAHDPRAHVISGGVDTDTFSPVDGVARTGNVLYVGRILPHKGINYLIDGLPDDMPLTIIGRASDVAYLEHLRTLAAGKAVTFRHDAEDAEIVEAYRRALCVVLPSVYRPEIGDETKVPELLGQTLLEGMSCGTPAICTDVASMPEVVEHEVTGFVVAPNDPVALRQRLVWLRDHASRALEMGAAGRRRVLDRFTWDVVVERCLGIYRGDPRKVDPSVAASSGHSAPRPARRL